MPRFDGTGPGGMGSMTGRGRGFCALPMRSSYYNRPTLLPWSREPGYGSLRYDSPSSRLMREWRGFGRGGGPSRSCGRRFGLGRRRW
ncbi:MAG: DUF5320 domain-containing protein [Deltaproteobacteria bacterium]|nr:DUF5320 domain-containing protein [Deltaproteobacteria bacterium]